LVIPLHKQIDRKQFNLEPILYYEIAHSDGPIRAEVFRTDIGQLPVYLIGGHPFDDADLVYPSDTLADGHKYTFFSLAALVLCQKLDWAPDILHAQDWHTSAAIYALKTIFAEEPFFQDTATLLTIHNLPYLGIGAGPSLKAFGLLPVADSTLPWWAQDMPLPLGLLTADKINTVSEGYAQEILTPEFGSGLDEFLKTRKSDLVGIINGLDPSTWNPKTDQEIKQNFNLQKLHKRRANKSALQREMNLPQDPQNPLLAFIGRMDHQKGVEIALDALRIIQDLEWQAIILGTGDHLLENQARSLESEMPDRIRAVIRFDGVLSRKIYAGADMMIIPSRYEPCGLIQMIAMRYGCVPVARATGGLRDTITDYREASDSTGFLFEPANPLAMAETLRDALTIYSDKRRWPYLQKRGMRQDFSWKNSALQYYKLYQSLVKRSN